MREILFKAKRLSDGEWVEGNIVNVPADADFMPGAYILPRLVSARADPPTKGIMLGGFFEVDRSTVCAYTGLTDKNGKKIFEGDKVKGKNDLHQKEEVYDVMWACNNGFYFVDDCETEWHPEHVIPCEIIGSIHDGEGDDDD